MLYHTLQDHTNYFTLAVLISGLIFYTALEVAWFVLGYAYRAAQSRIHKPFSRKQKYYPAVLCRRYGIVGPSSLMKRILRLIGVYAFLIGVGWLDDEDDSLVR